MSGIRRFHAIGLAVTVLAQLALAAAGASASPPPAKQKADHVRNLLEAYFQGRERSLFFATAGVDGEITKAEFTSATGRGNSFVRPYDRWAAVMAFDTDRNGRLGWVEAENYRFVMRRKMLTLFDKDGDGRLSPAERKAISAHLTAGTRRPRAVSRPADLLGLQRLPWGLRKLPAAKRRQGDTDDPTGPTDPVTYGLTSLLAGDVNLDGSVDGLDYTIWSNNYGTGDTWQEGDLNGDGTTDGLDYVLWSNNFGTVRRPANKDVWLSSVGAERDYNMGAATRIKLKIYQEFGIIDFDVSPLAGKTITSAKLYVRPAGGGGLNLNDGTDLRWLTVSTVSHEWVEGLSASHAPDPAGHGATFNESSWGLEDWGCGLAGNRDRPQAGAGDGGRRQPRADDHGRLHVVGRQQPHLRPGVRQRPRPGGAGGHVGHDAPGGADRA